MKVALGIFGQPRFYNLDHFKVIKRDIIDKYNADVYLHAWWDKSLTHFRGARAATYPVDPNTDVELVKMYNPKRIRIDPPIKLYEEEGGYCYDVFLQDGEDLQYAAPHPDSVEHMSSILSQARLYELIPWEEYDWIFRWRFDLIPIRLPDLHTLNPEKMYVLQQDGTEHGRPIFDDHCTIMSPKFKELMNLYHRLHLVASGNPPRHIPHTVPETLHMLHAQQLGVYDDIVKLERDEFFAEIIRSDQALHKHWNLIHGQD